MKLLITLLLLIFVQNMCPVCFADALAESVDSERTEIGSEGVQMMLSNGKISVTLGRSGEIVAVTSSDGAIQYLDNQVPESFALTVDGSTSDIWDSDPERNTNKTYTAQDAAITVYEEEAAVRYHYSIVCENGTIEVEKIYTLSDNELRIETCLSNQLESGVIVTITPAYLHHNDGTMSCLWPYKTGSLYENGVITDGSVNNDGSTEVKNSYPSLISMQLITLFDGQKTVSFTVEDKEAEYKDFSYKVTRNKRLSVSCCLYPFLAPGESKNLASVVLSFFDDPNWTVASDHYRDFLKEAGWIKTPNNAVNQFTGFTGWTMKVYNSLYYTKYTDEGPESIIQTMQAAMKAVQNKTGLNNLWITGWHVGGFDTYYPDYEFSEELGGASAFAKGVEEIHAVDGNVTAYLNVHMSDIESKWYNTTNSEGITYGDKCAIRKATGDTYQETYPTSPAQCVAMCPASAEFQQALLDATKRVCAAEINGIYVDQLCEMPAYLCYDPSHGHRTPATAYYEGYSSLLSALSDILTKSQPESILLCEGVADCYGKWIDVFCGYTDTNFLPYTRYTVPGKIIGRDLSSEGRKTYFSSAFVLGEPFVCHREYVQRDNSTLKRFLSLYERYSDIFLEGRYVYHNGFSGEVPENIQVGIMESSEGCRSAIQLYNTTKTTETTEIEFGYKSPTGTITQIYHAETGEPVEIRDGSITLSLQGGQSISIIFEYGND